MNISKLFILAATVFVLPMKAYATWPIDGCPSPYDSLACDAPGNDVCTKSGSTMVCTQEFSVYADTITAVKGGDSFSMAWGDVDGTDYCCSHQNVDHIAIDTGAGADTITLNYTDVFVRYDWEDTSIIYAGVGNDTINGSAFYDGGGAAQTCGGSWCDRIYPQGGSDTTSALAGKDYIAEPSADAVGNEISCGSGADTAYGGGASDTIYGGPGQDTLNGAGGVDYINGDNDADTIHGNEGADELCGGLGLDTVIGDAGYDECEDGNDSTTCEAGGSGNDGYCHW